MEEDRKEKGKEKFPLSFNTTLTKVILKGATVIFGRMISHTRLYLGRIQW